MSKELPRLPDDEQSSAETRRTTSTPPIQRSTDPRWRQPSSPPPINLPEGNMPPQRTPTQRVAPPAVSGEGHVRQTPGAPVQRKGKARARRDSGFYLPLWSLALMLVIVLGLSFSIVVLVVSLGSQNVPSNTEPQFIIITAASPTPTPPDNPAILATPTLPPEFDTQPDFSLEGPTLEPVRFTPTPLQIAVGVTVMVVAPESGLNVRSAAGINNEILFVAPDQQLLTVIGGPTQADSLTWWEVQDPSDPSSRGWAAGTYLEVVSP
jgi:hypothetical protein